MNKKLILSTMFAVLMVISCTETVNYEGVESAGKFMGAEDNELTGNPYVLGSDESVDIVMQAVAAYNAKDTEK